MDSAIKLMPDYISALCRELEIIGKVFDLRPGMIIKNFSLTKPSFEYHKLSNYGHFGRPDLNLPWEKLDKVKKIKSLLK